MCEIQTPQASSPKPQASRLIITLAVFVFLTAFQSASAAGLGEKDKRKILRLIDDLKSPSELVVERAKEDLSRFGRRALPVLMRYRTTNQTVKKHILDVVTALHVREEKRVKALIERANLAGNTNAIYERMTCPDPRVRLRLAIEAGASRSRLVVPLLMEFLLDADTKVVEHAASVLRRHMKRDRPVAEILLGHLRSIPPYKSEIPGLVSHAFHFSDSSGKWFLSAVSSIPDPGVRLAFVRHASARRELRLLPLHLHMLADKDAHVTGAARKAALDMRSLFVLGDPLRKLDKTVRAHIETRLAGLARSKKAENVRLAIVLFRFMPSPRAVKAVGRVLLRDLGPETAEEAVRAALAFADPALAPGLLHQLSRPGTPRKTIVLALGDMRCAEAYAPVEKLLAAGDHELRAACISALARIDGPRALSVIMEMLASARQDTRSAAARAAAGVLSREVKLRAEYLDRFMETLGAEDPNLRQSAADVIMLLDDQRVVTRLLRNLSRGRGLLARESILPLAALAGDKAGPHIRAALQSDDALLRLGAAQGLYYLGNAHELVVRRPLMYTAVYKPYAEIISDISILKDLNIITDPRAEIEKDLFRFRRTIQSKGASIAAALKYLIGEKGLAFDASFSCVYIGTAERLGAYRAWRVPTLEPDAPPGDIKLMVALKEKRVSLMGNGRRVPHVIREIARQAGIEAAFAPGYERAVPAGCHGITVTLREIRALDALRAILAPRGLGARIEKGKLLITGG
jgi:HEAT repeat protein